MPDVERRAITALTRSLELVLASGGGYGKKGHLPACNHGIWTPGTPRPEGAPCSDRCLEAQQAVEMGRNAIGLRAGRSMREPDLFTALEETA